MKYSAKSTRMAATLAFAAALGVPSGAQAAVIGSITRTGDTAGSATFNRPLEGLSDLSAVGPAVRYNTVEFSAAFDGESIFTTTGEYDTSRCCAQPYSIAQAR